ncbi:MAG TPA: helix-turn-helix transcriptional regulator [Candidatus Xenobia bacterium]
MNSSALREWLKRTGTTKGALARQAGLGRNTVSRLINGQDGGRVQTIQALSRVTGIPLASLLEEGSPHP